MKKSLFVILTIFISCVVAIAEDRGNLKGEWMLQVIEDKNDNSFDIKYGENILIFDDLLQMGCINNLKKNKRLSICEMDDYSVYAFDEHQMKLFCSGKILFDDKERTKRIVYNVILLNEDKLILEYQGQKAIYRRINRIITIPKSR